MAEVVKSLPPTLRTQIEFLTPSSVLATGCIRGENQQGEGLSAWLLCVSLPDK